QSSDTGSTTSHRALVVGRQQRDRALIRLSGIEARTRVACARVRSGVGSTPDARPGRPLPAASVANPAPYFINLDGVADQQTNSCDNNRKCKGPLNNGDPSPLRRE